MVKLVFYVNIPNIGISVIYNAKYAHSNKYMIFSIGNANTVLHQIHILMDYIVLFVRIINIIILPLIPVCHVQVVEYIIQFKWYANVHRIIHFRLPVDVYNVICLTILIKHHKHVCRALKIMCLTQVQEDVCHAHLKLQLPMGHVVPHVQPILTSIRQQQTVKHVQPIELIIWLHLNVSVLLKHSSME